MARMKNVISKNWLGQKMIDYRSEHIHKCRAKKKWVIVPVFKTEWLKKKPGANSWIARKEG
jgi:hypothetical protein